MTYTTVPTSVQQFMDDMTKRAEAENPRWAEIFNKCFANTLLTTVKRFDDGSTFLLTGDIPAMWLRDSTAQVRPYLAIAKEDDDLQAMIAGLVKRQFRYINLDPYANAFNEEANNAGHQTDHTEMNPGFGNANMKLIHYVTRFSSLTFSIKKQAVVINLMLHLKAVSLKF